LQRLLTNERSRLSGSCASSTTMAVQHSRSVYQQQEQKFSKYFIQTQNSGFFLLPFCNFVLNYFVGDWSQLQYKICQVIIRVLNGDPGWKKYVSRSQDKQPVHFSETFVTIVCQFSIVDPDLGPGAFCNLDPGYWMKKSRSGFRDKPPGSATLL
jgi:hypothetical protein